MLVGDWISGESAIKVDHEQLKWCSLAAFSLTFQKIYCTGEETEARRIQGLWWVPQTTPAGVSARIMTVHRVHTSVGVPAHHGREIHSYLSLLHIPSLGFSFPVSPRGRSSYMVPIVSH